MAVRVENIIFKVMMTLHNLHKAKAFNRTFWSGDQRLAEVWNIQLGEPKRRQVKIFKWHKPEQSWLKLNTFGLFNPATNQGACGGVLRDEEGRMLRGYQSVRSGFNALHINLLSICQGLSLSSSMHLDKIIIETSSKAALTLLQKSNQAWHWKLNTIISQIQQLCRDKSIRLSLVFKEANAIAMFLEKQAFGSHRNRVLEPGDMPIQTRQIAYKDKHGGLYFRKFRNGNAREVDDRVNHV